MLVASVRVYSSKKIKLVISHIATPSDPFIIDMNVLDVNSGKNLLLSKDEKQIAKYSELEMSIYQEQMQHHGYGFDVFFVH